MLVPRIVCCNAIENEIDLTDTELMKKPFSFKCKIKNLKKHEYHKVNKSQCQNFLALWLS